MGRELTNKKSFSKSTHTQDPESVYAGPKERDEACQWIHHQGMIFSTTWNAFELYFTKMCNQLDCSQWKYHFQALSLQVAPDTMATAYALFDRALFSMKVKRSHVGVLGMIFKFYHLLISAIKHYFEIIISRRVSIPFGQIIRGRNL